MCLVVLVTVVFMFCSSQTHAEKRRSALDTFIAESDKRSRQSMDRIANEEEQLRLKQEHVDLDEKLVVEEQQQACLYTAAVWMYACLS